MINTPSHDRACTWRYTLMSRYPISLRRTDDIFKRFHLHAARNSTSARAMTWERGYMSMRAIASGRQGHGTARRINGHALHALRRVNATRPCT
eukprot:scaffold95478_cov33-Tisochrysis_lutea.AAC.2